MTSEAVYQWAVGEEGRNKMPRMLLARSFHVRVKARLDRWALGLTPVLYKYIVVLLLELKVAEIVLRSE